MNHRSGPISEQDRVVWVGDESVAPIGSSFKARNVSLTHVAINAHGRYDVEWYARGTEIVSCEEAARRGVEPWASALSEET